MTVAASPAESAPDLRFANVTKAFPDGTVALRDVSVEVWPGELVAVVGPSGCGKSTLLRLASGLTGATAGTIDVRTTNLGYVFQDATLLPWRTVAKNIELFGELHGLSAAERRTRAAQAIETVGLSGFENHHPRQLSGGMRMRVSLARSLTLDPHVFLFDEPFGALDEITRERLDDELQRLFVEKRFSGLFITHSVYEAVYLCSRVLVMSARPGRIVADVVVPFDYPRTPELRFQPHFAELTGIVSAALREGHA